LPKRLVGGFAVVLSTIISIVRNCAEIVIEILVVDRSSAPPDEGRNRRRRSAAPSCHDLNWQQVISSKN